MSLINSSILFVAFRYMKGSRKQRFASFVAILATIGIAIGVSALIVVSSIMQGLQERLKDSILTDTAHVIVKASYRDIDYLLSIPKVVALVPFAQGEVILQHGDDITMVTLQGQDVDRLYISYKYAQDIGLTSKSNQNVETQALYEEKSNNSILKNQEKAKSNIEDESIEQALYNYRQEVPKSSFTLSIPQPESVRSGYDFGSYFKFPPNTYNLALNYRLLMKLDLNIDNEKVRLISTQNARYTPIGMTPVQRNFTVTDVIYSMDNSIAPVVMANYEDVRRFLLMTPNENYFRLYLQDPFEIESILPYLEHKYTYTDWRERYGEFFKAVGLEKITMSTMLCLIILVAAFNILSSLTMVVSSRINEIAILKTIGLTNRALLTIFVLVGMSASIVGSLLGLVIGIPFALNAQAILNAIGISIVSGELPIVIAPMNLVVIVILCMLISMLCTLYPAYCASKTDPVKTLTHM